MDIILKRLEPVNRVRGRGRACRSERSWASDRAQCYDGLSPQERHHGTDFKSGENNRPNIVIAAIR